MQPLNAQAKELNDQINSANPAVFGMLSGKGKSIYYPRRGILAQGAAAKGKDINATVGTAYEDNGDPMVIPSLARGLNIDAACAFPYAPSEGLKTLRDTWRNLIREKNPGLGNAPTSLPVVASGVTHALNLAGYLFLDDRDEIILPDLYWENYDLVFGNAYGGILKFFSLFDEGRFNSGALKQVLTQGARGKRVLLLNFPNNPTGYTPTMRDGAEIVKILREAAEGGMHLVVILDDSYFGLFFEEDLYRESLFAELAQLHPNLLAVKVDGITKEEYAWGFRVGFITFGVRNGARALYQALEDKTAGAVRGSISNACHSSQALFLQSLKSSSYAQEKRRNQDVVRARYLRVKSVLELHPEYRPYFESLPFNSGYFMCIRLKQADGARVWDQLLQKYSTGVVSYDDRNLFRVAFASTPMEKIEPMFNNIYLACKDCAES
jgi:aspartate/methionine/tyrosine aminotransferase